MNTLTTEWNIAPGISAVGSDALTLLAHGSPLARTLEAGAALLANIHESAGCAILLVTDWSFSIQAVQGLKKEDEQRLVQLSQLPYEECVEALRSDDRTEVHMLVTASAEIVGAVVVFDLPNTTKGEATASRVHEVCAIATIAIEGKHLIDELEYVAHHDPLTQIHNRLWLERKAATALHKAAESGFYTGMMTIGIDSFRVINELLGSQVGNDLLRAIAGRLNTSLRPNWSLARCGGDEFALLTEDLTSPDEIGTYAAEVLDIFQEPFELGDHELMVRATIGTSSSRPGECRGEQLQNSADIALRHGKHCARGRVSHFDKCMMSTPPERLELERHLRFALSKREFELYYQPQIQVSTGKLLGVEALLRWRHPSLGFISPVVFIPVAEQIGIIDEIGTWVLSEAVRQVAAWHRAGLHDLRVAVNVSAIQFSRDDFASEVADLLRRSAIPASTLELEITESTVMTNFQRGARQMKLLRALGVTTALDDFGTGHSSLAYLKQLPIGRLKIDRMFVKDISAQDEEHPLLSSIIQMGRALGLEIIAEGVETAEQVKVVIALGCDEIQGFFFCKPLPGPDVLAWAKEQEAKGWNVRLEEGGTFSNLQRMLSPKAFREPAPTAYQTRK